MLWLLSPGLEILNSWGCTQMSQDVQGSGVGVINLEEGEDYAVGELLGVDFDFEEGDGTNNSNNGMVRR